MRAELLQQLMAVDFAAHDTLMFLDTHPGDAKAMQLLAEYKRQSAELRERFQSQYGPLMAMESTGDGDWIRNPWPWDVQQDV